MIAKKLLISMGVAAGFGLLVSQSAFADFAPHREAVRHERGEVRGDWRELYRDRAELRQDLRHGAPGSEIAHDRAELRDDWRDLGRDRWDWRNDRRWDRDDWYRYRGWYDRFGYWHPYWR
jgi:hypothetical protein